MSIQSTYHFNMKIDPQKPYNELPKLPPIQEIKLTAVLRASISAGKGLAELKGLALFELFK